MNVRLHNGTEHNQWVLEGVDHIRICSTSINIYPYPDGVSLYISGHSVLLTGLKSGFGKTLHITTAFKRRSVVAIVDLKRWQKRYRIKQWCSLCETVTTWRCIRAGLSYNDKPYAEIIMCECGAEVVL